MITFKSKLLASGAALGLLLSLSTAVTAQTSDESTTVERHDEMTKSHDEIVERHDEIIVTARKREEGIQEVPLAITAFTAKMIQASNIRNMTDVAKFTPGFSLEEDFGRFATTRPVIRGQSTILGASGVSTFVDGIMINGSLLDYDLNDVERIEVIKGPQSALYGRNTYSGAVNIISKSPSDEFSGDIKVDAGSFNQFEIAGSVRGPFNNGVMSGGLTARYFTRGGPWTNTYDNTKVGQQESASLSGVLFYEPNDDLSVRTRLRFSQLHDDQLRNFNTPFSDNNIYQDFGGTYLGGYRYFEGEITAHPINVDDARLLGEKGFDKSDNIQGSISIDYAVNDKMNIEFLNGFNLENSRSKNEVGNTPDSLSSFFVSLGSLFGPGSNVFVISGPVADFALDAEGKNNDFSSELRVHYDEDKYHAMIGGYFFDGTVSSNSLRKAPPATAQMIREGFELQEARGEQLCTDRGYGPPDPCYFNVNLGDELEDLEYFADRSTHKSDLQNVAIFGSVDFEINQKLSLSAEARYASEKVTTHSTIRSMVYDYLGEGLRFEEAPKVSRSATFNSFNPRFTAKYQLTDGTNFYAVAARGNKPGGFNNLNTAPLGLDTFDEESVWSFEAGTKNTFMNGGLIFNLSAYHNTISDYQLTQTVFIPAINQTTTATSNLGKVRVMGLEAEMVFRPESIEGLVFNANYSLADSEFLEGTDITEGRHNDTLDDGLVNCSIGFANPDAMTCASGDNVLPGSIVGRQLPRAPRHSFSVGANYETPISDNTNLILNANANYESKKYVQVHNLAYYGEALLVNGSIGVESNGLSLTVWGRNLLQEDSIVASSRYIDEALSFNRAFLGTLRVPRSFGATLRKSF